VISSLTQRTFGAGRRAFSAAARIPSLTELSEDRAPIAILEAPACAKEVAIARPIPRDAPAMKTDLLLAGLERGEIAG
jgi:hypothetical protein